MSRDYEARHDEGDAHAIFEYVSQHTWAFRSEWVVAQVEQWRDAGDRRSLARLMRSYGARKGKRRPTHLLAEIRRDQEVYRALLDHGTPRGTLFKALQSIGRQFNLSPQAIKEIRDAYHGLWKRVEPLGLFASPIEMLADLRTTIDTIAELPSQRPLK